MTIVLTWLLLAGVLALVATGCGLVVEQLSGFRLPGALVPPVGLAVVFACGDLTTMYDATAELTTPLVVTLAVAGLGLSFPWTGRRVDAWAVVSAIGAYGVYSLPILLTGTATFAGYLTLDDTATWLALADHVMEHGRTVSSLAPSTYQQVLADYLATSGYPVGTFTILGVGSDLTGQDVAWLFQPTIAFFGAMLALAIYAATADLIASRAFRAVVALLASQPALLFAYAFWSGVKELAATAMVALLCALLATTSEHWRGIRGVVPVAVAVAAILAILSPAGGIWLVVPALVVVVLALRGGPISFARTTVVFVALIALLSVPTLAIARTFVGGASSAPVTQNSEVARLGHPLSTLQVFGIWPATDFRTSLHDPVATYVLIAVLVLCGVFGLVLALRMRAWSLPLFLATALGGVLLAFGLERLGLSSPWLNAKAMAEASPAIVAIGVAGALALFERGRRVEGSVACAAIAVGVLWSNALAYSNVWLAPRAQLVELESIGERYAGAGPTLITEHQPYGARHFLRAMDPEAASERRRRVVPLRGGGSLEDGDSADLDSFQLEAILVYKTLVQRTSPVASRPPSIYRLLEQGRWYDVWQRDDDQPELIEHLSLGSPLDPAAVPSCGEVLRLAERARRAGGVLATVSRPGAPIVLDVTQGSAPARWKHDPDLPGTLVPHGGGTLRFEVTVPTGGRYDLWLGGSFRRTATVHVDGQPVGSVTHLLNNDEQFTPLGARQMVRGSHTVELDYGGSRLAPGAGGLPFALGPLVLSTTTSDLPITYVQPGDASSLCGKRLDWVEAMGARS
jgi:hypothetical protein